jgi:RHS repeat-associated protein
MLWRAEFSHFTDFDLNPPWAFLSGGGFPNADPIRHGDVNDCRDCNELAELENQVLGEEVPITGSDLDLVYRSSRTNDYLAASEMDIPLTPGSIEPSLRRVELDVDVAGQHHAFTYSPETNLEQHFAWNGQDGYGRRVNGHVPARVTIRYVYPMIYRMITGENGATTWTIPCTSTACDVPDDVPIREVSREASQSVLLGGFEMNAAGLGGWSLTTHHAYDPTRDGALYRGDGVRELGLQQMPTVTIVPNTAAMVIDISDVTLGPDRCLYFAEISGSPSASSVWRVDLATGTKSLVAGGNGVGYEGDNAPATEATLGEVPLIAFGPAGSLYIGHGGSGSCAVRRVGLDGIITTVAGNGSLGSTGDGGPATAATINDIGGLAVGADGSIYVSERSSPTVRRITPDGIIRRFAGQYGSSGFDGEGGPALDALLNQPRGLAIGPDGSLYIADQNNRRVRKVNPQGIITTFAGSDNSGGIQDGDGGPATAAKMLNVRDVAVGPDGSVYIIDPPGPTGRIRRVGIDGIITTVAGGGTEAIDAGEKPARAISANSRAVAIDAIGRLFFQEETGDFRSILRSQSTAQGFGIAPIALASYDGRELYAFDHEGRHLFTLDGMTGDTLFSFRYDGSGLLDSFKDRDGRWTDIERSGAQATAILTPDGLRTTLSYDGNGHLTAISNPAGNAVGFSYTSGGLMIQRTSPRNYATTFGYDNESGRLTSISDPEGGLWTLDRDLESGGHSVTVASREGQVTKATIARSVTGELYREYEDVATGLAHTLQEDASRGVAQGLSDGILQTVSVKADPRFGLMSPVPTVTITTPEARQLSVVTNRTTDASTDPLDFDQFTETVTVNGNATVNTFDRSSRILTVASPLNRRLSIELDNTGRPTRVAAESLDALTILYDNGRVTQIEQGRRGWQASYDDSGRIAVLRDTTQYTTGYRYDAAGRLLRQTLPDGTALGLRYDNAGNVDRITPPSKPSHEFQFTALDHTSDYLPPAVGVTPPGIEYAYNDDGRLGHIDRPDGQDVDIGYDPSGRVKTIATARGDRILYYRNSASGAGHPESLSCAGGPTLSYRYDGSLTTEESWSGTLSGAVRHEYDDFLRMSGQSLRATSSAADTLSVAFGYDADGLLTSAGGLNLDRSMANGLLKSATLGGVVTHYSYTGAGEVKQDSTVFNGATLRSTTYDRDDAGRITVVSELINGMRTIDAYGYDDAARLHTVTRNGVLIATYDYDDNGNRTAVTRSDTMSATIDYQDRMTRQGDTAYEYTAVGDLRYALIDGDTTVYDYDAFGNLRSVILGNGTHVEYIIDGHNRRVGKTVNGLLVRQWLYQDRNSIVAEMDGEGHVVARFVYGTRWHVPDYMVSGDTAYRFVTDHLGSVRMVVNTVNGRVAQAITYDPWGGVESDSNAGLQPFRYAGGLMDQEAGLIRFGARDYDPRTGRWVTKDPIGFGGGSWSLYVYAWDRPQTAIDPLGLGHFGTRPIRPLWFKWGGKTEDKYNCQCLHEQYFFDDNTDVGYFDGGNPFLEVIKEYGRVMGYEMPFGLGHGPGVIRPDDATNLRRYTPNPGVYDDEVMRRALADVSKDYEGQEFGVLFNNCQMFAEDLRRRYRELGGSAANGR